MYGHYKEDLFCKNLSKLQAKGCVRVIDQDSTEYFTSEKRGAPNVRKSPHNTDTHAYVFECFQEFSSGDSSLNEIAPAATAGCALFNRRGIGVFPEHGEVHRNGF
jgi:hypothetical protein